MIKNINFPPHTSLAWTEVVGNGAPITAAVRKSALFVFYPLTVIGLLAPAAHFLLAPIIAVINRHTFTLYCEP